MASFALHEFLHAGDHVALQIFLGGMLLISLDTFRLDASLAFRAFLPTYLRALITTYMDIFGREKIDDLAQYVF